MNILSLLIAALLVAAQLADVPPLRAGASIAVQIRSTVKADKAKVDDEVLAEVTVPVLQDGRVLIPRGARVIGRVTAAAAHTKEHPESLLAVRFERAEWKDGSIALNAYIARALMSPPEKKKVVQYGPVLCMPQMHLLPQQTTQQQSAQAGGQGTKTPPPPGPPPQPMHVPTICDQQVPRVIDSPDSFPSSPKLADIFIRTLDNPLGPTELISTTKNVTLPSGLVVELRQVAP